MEEHWSLGAYFGFFWFGLLGLLCLIALVVGIVWLFRPDPAEGRKPAAALVIGALVASLLVIGWARLPVVGMGPWDTDYHKWKPIAGTVTGISSRIIKDGDAVNQRFVVTFADGQTRSCDDTRCALVKEGDWLALACKKHWQYAATDGWDCNFLDTRSGGAS